MKKRATPPICARIPFRTAAESIAVLAKNGIGIEIALTGSDVESGGEAAVALGKKLGEAKVPSSLHAPFADLLPGSPDDRVREVARDRMLQTAALARHLAPRHVVVHAGFDRWRNGRDVPYWLERSAPIWAEMAGALPHGVKILFENVFEENPSSIIELLDALPKGRFGACFDAGHCNLFSTVTIGRWLRSLGDRIEAFHLHDNGGLDDDHRPIGEGKITFDPVWEHVRERTVLVLENAGIDETLRSLQKLRDILR